MVAHELAGKPAPAHLLIDPARLERDYFDIRPDPAERSQRVSFGTSGHRGTSAAASFNEAHILAITQAICDYRQAQGISGPLYMGRDSHLLSAAAQRTALEVLAANGVSVYLQRDDGLTPTPVISRAIVVYNCGRSSGFADGIVITPSHNPPADGGFKYNPPEGGPAGSEVTGAIETRANQLLESGLVGLRRVPFDQARRAATTFEVDFGPDYIADLASVLDLDAIRASGLRIGVDPLGGASLPYWEPIAAHYGFNLTVVNRSLDPTFGFMTVDRDGKIRMDCSSPYAMAGLVGLKDQFDIACGSDPDADRHGIVTPSSGLLNPNHYLAVAIDYLLAHRPGWPAAAAVGKTLVSSALIDRVVAAHGRKLCEVPVGFKWFVDGLLSGDFCFGGEESAGASFLRQDGSVWTTDKDGLLLGLLAAEITAVTGQDPGLHYRRLAAQFGEPAYSRIDAAASLEHRERLARLAPADVHATEVAGDRITALLTNAPGNGAAIGGLKVVTANGWFAARPSGTEDIYKLYAESFRGPDHLRSLLRDAGHIVQRATRA